MWAFFGSLLSTLLGTTLTRAIIWKAIIYALFVTVLPIVLYNLFNEILLEMIQYAGSFDVSGQQSITYQFTGLAGWFATRLKLPECFSLIFSALAFRVTIAFVPFLNRI